MTLDFIIDGQLLHRYTVIEEYEIICNNDFVSLCHKLPSLNPLLTIIHEAVNELGNYQIVVADDSRNFKFHVDSHIHKIFNDNQFLYENITFYGNDISGM